MKKIDSLIALILNIYIKFLNLLFFNLLNKFIFVSLALLSTLITSLLLALNTFKTNFSDDLIIFDIKINCTAILLKL